MFPRRRAVYRRRAPARRHYSRRAPARRSYSRAPARRSYGRKKSYRNKGIIPGVPNALLKVLPNDTVSSLVDAKLNQAQDRMTAKLQRSAMSGRVDLLSKAAAASAAFAQLRAGAGGRMLSRANTLRGVVTDRGNNGKLMSMLKLIDPVEQDEEYTRAPEDDVDTIPDVAPGPGYQNLVDDDDVPVARGGMRSWTERVDPEEEGDAVFAGQPEHLDLGGNIDFLAIEN